MLAVAFMYLQGAYSTDGGHALQVLGVAAAGTALHLHAGRPQQEVGVMAVQHGARHLHHLRPHLALSLLCHLDVT